jgi:hypothetical protein
MKKSAWSALYQAHFGGIGGPAGHFQLVQVGSLPQGKEAPSRPTRVLSPLDAFFLILLLSD